MVVAIDGPGGAGKSTVAGAVAQRLGVAHLDTGATYRAATVAALEAGADPDDEEAVLEAVEAAVIEYDDGRISLDGIDITDTVRSDAVNAAVSRVSVHPRVRSRIVELQRAWVADRGGEAVVEGRDIGTVVFPDADVKVFITARPEVRAARRSGDAEAAHKDVAEIERELARRDQIDSTRRASPLKPAPDALMLDTSDMGVYEVVERVMQLIESARAATAADPLRP